MNMKNRIERLSRVGIRKIVGMAAVIGLGAFTAIPALALDKVTFLTNWYAQAEHGGFYAAVANGIYEKYGLDVTIRMGGPQVNVLMLLAAGEADFIMGYDIQVMNAIAKGIPAVTVGVSFQKDLQGVIAHADVKSLEQLQGKTILLATAPRNTWWPWLKEKYDLSDSQVRPYTYNLQPFIINEDAAQQGYMTSEPFQLRQKGVDISYFLLADYGWPPYGNTIVTLQDMVAEQPDLVERFVHASMEGWKQYLEDPTAANELIQKANPRMTDEQLAFALERFKESGALTGGAAQELGIGAMSADRYKATYEFLVDFGLLDADVDYTKSFTTQFVEDLRVMP